MCSRTTAQMSCPVGVTDSCPDAATGISAQLFLSMINALFVSKCNINSPDLYPEDAGPLINDGEEFDYIIIGGGSAGSNVGNRLSANPKLKVLVLEAGKLPSLTSEIPLLFTFLQGTEEDWQYSVEPSGVTCLGFKDGRCLWPRGKALGGSSVINAMLYIRGNRRDYDSWVKSGNPGWDYKTVLENYKKFEKLDAQFLPKTNQYGKNGYLPMSDYQFAHPIKDIILSGTRMLGYPTLKEEGELGFFETLLTIDHGVRASTGKEFLGKVKDRENLFVSLNSLVQKLVIDENKVVTGVVVKIGDRIVTLKSSREVIVSAGSINTPQVLMLSGIGPKKHLDELGIPVVADLQVGENLHDHTWFPGFSLSFSDPVSSPDPIDSIYEYFQHQEGEYSEINLIDLTGFINTKRNSLFPNLQYMFAYFNKQNPALQEFFNVNGYLDEITAALATSNSEASTVFMLPILIVPKSRGRVQLRSTSPDDKPLIYWNSFENQEDLDILLEGIRFLEKLIKTPGFKRVNASLIELPYGCDGFEPRSDKYWECALRSMGGTIYHPVGTCKMGPSSDRNAVVNSRLQVHGINNLRVIDASIMPQITSGNTNAPSILIGEMGSRMILEDLQRSQ